MKFKSYLADAASYWERKRLIYNGVLALLAAACWGPEILMGGPSHWLGGGLVLLFFAIVANVLFCAAYPVDLALQFTPWRSWWMRLRPALFCGGVLLASSLALWVMLGTGMA